MADPGVKSDRTLFEILDCISESDGVRLNEIADRVGMSKSAVHDHLASLREEGYVVREGDEYHLGLTLFNYGIGARNQWDIFEAAKPKLEELVEAVSERAWCFVEFNHEAVYLAGAAAENPVKTPHRLGHQTYLHHIAGGKAILAHLPEEYVNDVIDDCGLPAFTEHTITDRAELAAELETVREEGIAYNREEAMQGLKAIGAPVMSVDGDVYGSISLSGPANRFTAERIDAELRELLLGAANEIELNLREF